MVQLSHSNINTPCNTYTIMTRLLAALLLTLSFTNTCLAGLIGSWELPHRSLTTTIEYKDDNNIRISIGKDMYMLFKDGESYMITGQSVVDADAFREEIKDWAIADFLAERMKKRSARVKTQTLSETDRTETIFGITGKVFVATMHETGTKEPITREIVLTQDDRLVRLKKIMDHFADNQMSKVSRPEFTAMHEIMQNTFDSDSAILRYGDRFILSSVEEKEIDAKRFQLPENIEIKVMPGLTEIGSILKLMMPVPEK